MGREGGCICEDAACPPGRLDGQENGSSHGYEYRRGGQGVVWRRGSTVEPVRRVGSMDRSMDAHMGGEARSEKRRRFSATLVLSTLRRSAY